MGFAHVRVEHETAVVVLLVVDTGVGRRDEHLLVDPRLGSPHLRRRSKSRRRGHIQLATGLSPVGNRLDLRLGQHVRMGEGHTLLRRRPRRHVVGFGDRLDAFGDLGRVTGGAHLPVDRPDFPGLMARRAVVFEDRLDRGLERRTGSGRFGLGAADVGGDRDRSRVDRMDLQLEVRVVARGDQPGDRNVFDAEVVQLDRRGGAHVEPVGAQGPGRRPLHRAGHAVHLGTAEHGELRRRPLGQRGRQALDPRHGELGQREGVRLQEIVTDAGVAAGGCPNGTVRCWPRSSPDGTAPEHRG